MLAPSVGFGSLSISGILFFTLLAPSVGFGCFSRCAVRYGTVRYGTEVCHRNTMLSLRRLCSLVYVGPIFKTAYLKIENSNRLVY